MHVFYAPGLNGTSVTLSGEESLHLAKVLRLQPGDRVRLIDGAGGTCEGVVLLAHPKHSEITDIRLLDRQKLRDYYLHIAMAPTKMMERFEWFLEKATEIGIDEITPLLTSRTERTGIKKSRMEKVVQAAMKQSMTAFHPVLNELTPFGSFLKAGPVANGFIAHCIPGSKPHLLEAAGTGTRITVLIGPEGDFTPEEAGMAEAAGYRSVTLGQSRLRTETAGIVVCAQLQAIRRLA